MSIKYYYISARDGRSLSYLDIRKINFDNGDFSEIEPEIIDKIDFDKLEALLQRIMNGFHKKIINGPEADKLLYDHIIDIFPLSLIEAANADLWNGFCILNDSICEFIKARWEYKPWFRKKIPLGKKDGNQIRRYVTGSGPTVLARGTIPRIWWARKLVNQEYRDVLWKQQDLVDGFLMRTLAYIDENGNINHLTNAFFNELKEREENDSVKERERVVRQVLKWLIGLENYTLLDTLDQEKIRKNVKSFFDIAEIRVLERKTKKRKKEKLTEKSEKKPTLLTFLESSKKEKTIEGKESVSKILSKTDIGQSSTHQSGILITKEMSKILPVLDLNTEKPEKMIFLKKDEQIVKVRYLYYHSKNEFRITRIPNKWFIGANAGDILEIKKNIDGFYEMNIIIKNED